MGGGGHPAVPGDHAVRRHEAPLAAGAGGAARGRRRGVGGGQPLRQVAARLGVARSTLRGWRATVPVDEMPAEVVAGLSTPAGARWLHRLVVAMHLVITLRAGAGVRLVCDLLRLGGLSGVVGASYGSQQAMSECPGQTTENVPSA